MSTRVSTLGNGLRVASASMPQLETAALGVWVATGARNESASLNGVSHLLEHMAFKGTERRSARAIVAEIEQVGGHLNAHTGREQTAYTARVLKDDVGLALDILADILQRSVFDETELERERGVVLQEIAQVEDTPDDLVFDHFQAAAYPDQPLGRPILGPAALIRSLPREALAGYMRTHYTAPRMVVSYAGPLEHEAFVEAVARHFAAVPAAAPPACAPARYAGSEVREERDLEQVHFVLGFDGLAYGDDDYFALAVLSTVLGGGMSSRLFQEVREKRGLAYSVFTFASSYMDCGLFGVYAGTAPARAGELVPVVCEELNKMAETVPEAEVAAARNQIKAGLLMALESPAARAEQLAHQLLVFGRVLPLSELIARIEAVDGAALARLARRLFCGAAPALAAIGPLSGLEGYERIRRRFAA